MKVRFPFAWAAQPLTGLPPLMRRSLLFGIDALLLPLSVWLSFWLRLAHPFHPTFLAAGTWFLPTVLLVGLPLYVFTGQYKGLTRYVGSQAFYRLAGRNGLLMLLVAAIGDAVAADAAKQLDSLVVAAHRIHGGGALCLEGCLAQFALHAAQTAVACRHLWRR